MSNKSLTLKQAVDSLADINTELSPLESRKKTLVEFIKANMSGMTAYGEHAVAQLTIQQRETLDKSLIPENLLPKYLVNKEVKILTVSLKPN